MTAPVTSESIELMIRAVVAEWIAADVVPNARSIGDGLCEEFAEEIASRLRRQHGTAADAVTLVYSEDWWARALLADGSPDPHEAEMFVTDIPRLRSEGAPLPDDVPDDELANLLGAATHVWIGFEGRHFDASAPAGAAHFLMMPFYADQIAGLRAELAGG